MFHFRFEPEKKQQNQMALEKNLHFMSVISDLEYISHVNNLYQVINLLTLTLCLAKFEIKIYAFAYY